MNQHIIVGVPLEDIADVEELAVSLDCRDAISEHQYIDGTPYVDIFIDVLSGGAAWLTLRTWITTRANKHKKTRITFNGIEIEGVSPRDAERIIKLIEQGDGSQ